METACGALHGSQSPSHVPLWEPWSLGERQCAGHAAWVLGITSGQNTLDHHFVKRYPRLLHSSGVHHALCALCEKSAVFHHQ